MPAGISPELHLAFQGQLDFPRRHDPLFNDSVRDDDSFSAVEEIEHAVLNPLKSYAQLVNSSLEEIGFRPPQLMAELLQALQTHTTFVLRLGRNCPKPVEEGNGSIFGPEQNDLG